jgi:hypothetical protein
MFVDVDRASNHWPGFLLADVSSALHDPAVESFVDRHSGALTILALAALLMLGLLILVPQLLRARQRLLEMHHAQVMAALEKGITLPGPDDRSRAAGRTALLVPMVTICAAATVTCFLSAFRPDSVFSVTLAVWSVAGVVSLAAITGGVALMGRLAHIQHGMDPDADRDAEAELPPEKEREEQPR